MLRWAVICFIIAIAAGLLGFFGLEHSAAVVAKVLFVAFLVLALVSLLVGRRGVPAV
jgi:uncharacterized membrane protein YtjA (UPF0391 family)